MTLDSLLYKLCFWCRTSLISSLYFWTGGNIHCSVLAVFPLSFDSLFSYLFAENMKFCYKLKICLFLCSLTNLLISFFSSLSLFFSFFSSCSLVSHLFLLHVLWIHSWFIHSFSFTIVSLFLSNCTVRYSPQCSFQLVATP